MVLFLTCLCSIQIYMKDIFLHIDSRLQFTVTHFFVRSMHLTPKQIHKLSVLSTGQLNWVSTHSCGQQEHMGLNTFRKKICFEQPNDLNMTTRSWSVSFKCLTSACYGQCKAQNNEYGKHSVVYKGFKVFANQPDVTWKTLPWVPVLQLLLI